MGIYGGPERNLLPDIATGVNEEQGELLPEGFKLYQNYPNPFNPSTIISWELVTHSYVSLKVYDVLGNEIFTIIDKEQPAGKYEVEFDVSNLPEGKAGLSTGIYFYQLRTSGFSDTKKLIYLK
jgi:hypothetical protein